MGNLLTAPYISWWSGQFLEQISATEPAVVGDVPTLFGTTLQTYLQWAHAGIIWVLANILFDRYLGLRLYRYENVKSATNAEMVETPQVDTFTAPDVEVEKDRAFELTPPRFLSRAATAISAVEINALKAEEHYVRIFTDVHEELVLYRFSDAVAEMGPTLGLQVHRSYWVAESAIDCVDHDVRKMTLTLKSGTQIPVSARYQEIVRQRIPESDMS